MLEMAAFTPEQQQRWREADVTRIHGVWYDMNGFKHPGGPVALSLGFHRDATVLFESHHPFTSRALLAALLQQQRVPAEAQTYLTSLYPEAVMPKEAQFDFRAAAASLGIDVSDNNQQSNDRILPTSHIAASTPAASPLVGHVPAGLEVGLRRRNCASTTPASSDDDNECCNHNGIDSDTESDASSQTVSSSEQSISGESNSYSSVGGSGRRRQRAASRSTAPDQALRQLQAHDGGRATNAYVSSASTAASTSSAQQETHGYQLLQQQQQLQGNAYEYPGMDAFEAQVKRAAMQYFRSEASKRGVSLRQATKAPAYRWAQLLGLALAFIFAGIVPLYSGWWPAVFIAPTLGWLWMVNHWHDAAHFAMSCDWRLNCALTYLSPWFSSPLIWYHQHVIGHHSYTNVPGADPDLYHAPRFWRFTHSLSWKSTHSFQSLTTLPLWLLSVPTLLLLKPIIALQAGVYNRCVVLMRVPQWRIAAHVAGRLAVAASLYVWPWFVFSSWACNTAVPSAAAAAAGGDLSGAAGSFDASSGSSVASPLSLSSVITAASSALLPLLTDVSQCGADGSGSWLKATVFAVVPMAVYSLWFMACSQVNHHTDDNHSHTPAVASSSAAVGGGSSDSASGSGSGNWYRHQVLTSHTVAPSSGLAFWLSGGLSLQIEHHLLPCVNHVHLRALQPAIEAAAALHGVHYTRSNTIPEAFRKLWAHLRGMGARPAHAQQQRKHSRGVEASSKLQ